MSVSAQRIPGRISDNSNHRNRQGAADFCRLPVAMPTRSIAMTLANRFAALVFAILLASLVGCAGTSTKESTGEYFDDTVVTSKVKTAILNEPSLKSAQINVETFKGVVQLTGFVSSRAEINRAGEVARGVAGVASVRNDMRLR